ncbi:hypothetical protein BDW69DRAFT_183147 [Aspergillus filifer]
MFDVHSPTLDSEQWNSWLGVISSSNTAPDIYSWHQIDIREREPDATIPDFNALLTTYGLPHRPIDVNEYAASGEQNPTNAVFFISQLERHNCCGLRANWGGGLDYYLANLVYKTDDDQEYYPNGEWYVYEYYVNMTEDRLLTAASPDLQFDMFATMSGGEVKIFAGTRTVQEASDVTVLFMSSRALGYQEQVSVQVLRYD